MKVEDIVCRRSLMRNQKTPLVGIYIIINPLNQMYIGKSKNIKKRWRDHLKTRYNKSKLFTSYLEYGFEEHRFEILEECLELDLDSRESYWIDYYDAIVSGLNTRKIFC